MRSRRAAQNPRAPRRRLTGARRRESIVDVARQAFASRGYEGVRTQDLAKAAGISEALIYQHFESKRGLYREVVRHTPEALEEQLGRVAAEARDGERLERGLDAFLAFVADRSSGWALVVAPVSDPEVASDQQEARAACISELTDLFAAEASTASVATRRRLEQLAEVVAGGAEALANWWSQNPKAGRQEGTSMLLDFACDRVGSILSSAEGDAKRKSRRRAG